MNAEMPLASLLTELQRPGEKDSDIDRPGWRDPKVLQGLTRIATSSANAEETRTARTWLAAVEFEKIQAETERNAIQRKVETLNGKLDQIIVGGRNSWQGKTARLMKSNALLFARRWDDCRAEIASILQDIETFKTEQNPNFIQFLAVQKKAPTDLEAEARFLLVIVSALENKYETAIKEAEELQSRYPIWSKKEKIDDVIEFLKKGTSPFRIP